MIETDKRKAVFLLHQEGHSVRTIIGQGGAPPAPQPRADKLPLDEALLRRLCQECQGHVARVHEKLVEEEGVVVAYSTLAQRLRQSGISDPPKVRCQHVPDEPGAEMQHDTSLYPVELAGRRVRLIASLIYLRYSKRRYLKFYRGLDRFKMKCFFHDYALPTKGLARHQFLRRLLALSRQRSVELFTQTVERARKYRITDLPPLRNIAWLYLQQGPGQVPLAEIDAAFRQREAYQEGCLTDPPELPPEEDPPSAHPNPS
jgi:hypothetical protein